MEKLKIETVKQIHYCPKGKPNVPLDECKKCMFFDGFDDDAVKCVQPDFIKFHSMIVTEFTIGDKKYKYRVYNEEIDGEITGNDPYDYCQKCDMLKVLPNGKRCCALRNGIPTDVTEVMYPFICEDGKIWKEVVKK